MGESFKIPFNMFGSRKIIVGALVAILVLVILSASFSVCYEHGHVVTSNDCYMCTLAGAADSKGVAGGAGFVFSIFAFIALIILAGICLLREKTPVNLKTRLNN